MILFFFSFGAARGGAFFSENIVTKKSKFFSLNGSHSKTSTPFSEAHLIQKSGKFLLQLNKDEQKPERNE